MALASLKARMGRDWAGLGWTGQDKSGTGQGRVAEEELCVVIPGFCSQTDVPTFSHPCLKHEHEPEHEREHEHEHEACT